MREALKERDQERFSVVATVKRYGGKLTSIPKLNVHDWQETILLVDLKDAVTGSPLADHIWFKVGKTFEKLNAKTGDTIQFDARVDEYYKKAGSDYHLERPTRMKILSSDPALFPEETARTVGTGVEFAQQLKEQYQLRREDEFSSYRLNWREAKEDDFTVREPSEVVVQAEERNQKIKKLRAAHEAGLIQLKPKMLQKGGFKKVPDEKMERLLKQVKQAEEAAKNND